MKRKILVGLVILLAQWGQGSAKAKSCPLIMAAFSSLAINATAAGDLISEFSDSSYWREHVLFDPRTYEASAPTYLIDFREPHGWIFHNGIYNRTEVSRIGTAWRPTEEHLQQWYVDASELPIYLQNSSFSIYDLTPHTPGIYEFWTLSPSAQDGQMLMTHYKWKLDDRISGPRPIILDDGFYRLDSRVPEPGSIVFLMGGIAFLHRGRR
ncbi:MAG: hypothetical protein COV44_06735 [Deltaproteobacteria bacterium CG11_big_fil_rev_8_21_14_0_20_45_16]|nr:MAG: hypothetical protein COV44_06735 [Deltaproteobacteria bacterium CG11_big_fil_rev_8_21_14_0_20_45_16]